MSNNGNGCQFTKMDKNFWALDAYMAFENMGPRTGYGAMCFVADRFHKSRIFEAAMEWRCLGKQQQQMGSLLTPGHRNGLLRFSLFLEHFLAENFEKKWRSYTNKVRM